MVAEGSVSGVNTYRGPEVPGVEDFAIVATELNSAYIQAAIATGRRIYPSVEQYIQMGELIARQEPLRWQPGMQLLDRAMYPAFLRDASPFEIFRVYQGLAVDAVILLINRVVAAVDASEPVRIMLEGTFPEYEFSYGGFVRRGLVDRAALELNPTNFLASITPEQAILMEEWRTKRMTGLIYGTRQLLDLNQMQGQLIDVVRERRLRARNVEFTQYMPMPQIPKHYHLGFTRRALRDAVLAANYRIPRQVGRPIRALEASRENRISNIITDYIRYEGETAVDRFGDDRRHKKLPISESFPKEYYMMLYHELIVRGVITDATARTDPQILQLENQERTRRNTELRLAEWVRLHDRSTANPSPTFPIQTGPDSDSDYDSEWSDYDSDED